MPHLLLVDDDLFRESLGLNLVDQGSEVTSFDNGREALAHLNGGSADIMLLDWRMPELTGIDVLRQTRDAGISIPVIFLTVLSDDIYKQAALEGGAVVRRRPPQISTKTTRGLSSPSGWDREFESPFLQRRVSCEPDLLRGEQ